MHRVAMRWGVAWALAVTMAAGASAQVRGTTGTMPAADYYEIQQLYSRFCHGLDSAGENGYMFASVFTPDGVYVDPAGKTYTGREELAQLARLDPDGKKGPTHVSHYVTNVQITPTAAGALGTGYLMQGQTAPQTRPGGPPPQGRAEVTEGGLYRDELVKTADGWRIRKRTFARPGTAAR